MQKWILNEVYSKKEEVDGDDLYDAAIEPSGISEKRESSENVVPQVKVETSQPTNYVSHNINSSSAQHQTGKRYCCYVGNMTWWTTDNDLQVILIFLYLCGCNGDLEILSLGD